MVVRRNTWQREAVREALDSSEGFVSAQSLHTQLREAGSPIGLATVYRALSDLASDGSADSLQQEGESLYRACTPARTTTTSSAASAAPRSRSRPTRSRPGPARSPLSTASPRPSTSSTSSGSAQRARPRPPRARPRGHSRLLRGLTCASSAAAVDAQEARVA